mgnify:CR=1 FL=1|jgi:hypothetical protein
MAVKCDQLVYTPTSPLTFRISGGTKTLTAHKTSKGIIHALEGGADEINFTLGLILTVEKYKYKINLIEEIWTKNVLVYDIHIAKRTKSSIFLLPMFGGDRYLYLWNQLFMNCFILEEENEPYIQLLYRFSGDPLFLKFEQALTKFKSFLRKEDPDDGFVLFTFKVPKKHLANYMHFKNGEYSLFSKLYKMNILEFHDFEVTDLIGQVLFQSSIRRNDLEIKLDCELPEDSELLSIIDIDQETFNPQIYFNNDNKKINE